MWFLKKGCLIFRGVMIYWIRIIGFDVFFLKERYKIVSNNMKMYNSICYMENIIENYSKKVVYVF